MSTISTGPATSARNRFERDGYAIFENVLDPQLVEEGRRHVGWLQQRHPDLRPEQLGNRLVADDAFWVRLVADGRLLDLAEQFIGPDIALFASHYIAKPSRSGQAVLWHQDGAFWPLEPMEVVSLWVALDDTDATNGCLRVVPGTHLWDLKPNRRSTDVANVLNAEIDVDPALIDEEMAVDIALRAGDVEVHHPNIIHGSHANTSPHWRRGLTIRYIPTTTRIVSTEPWPSAFLLRGEAVPGVNSYRSLPLYDEIRHMPFRGSDEWAAGRTASSSRLVRSTPMQRPPDDGDELRLV
jgi:phytanoyl-CoA hydroxylase